MRNIWRIIKADARSLFTHFSGGGLAIGVLPSLYAWLNIYSNWDPYGNTGNISIAAASLDKGWTEGRHPGQQGPGGGGGPAQQHQHQLGHCGTPRSEKAEARCLCRGLLRRRGH